MRYIQKNTEPRELIEYKAITGADYDDLPSKAKEAIRNSLIEEQGSICGYCMQRIPNSNGNMKIEHIKPQSLYPKHDLDYNNMIGCCMGNEGKPRALQHCDTRKGNQEITISPLDRAIEAQITFTRDGRIRYYNDDCSKQTEIDEILNLNCQQLRDNRAAVIQGIRDALSRKNKSQSWSRASINTYLNTIKNKERKIPYYQIAIWYLEKKLRKCSN